MTIAVGHVESGAFQVPCGKSAFLADFPQGAACSTATRGTWMDGRSEQACARAPSPRRINFANRGDGWAWTFERRRRALVRQRILRCRPSGPPSGRDPRACAGPTPSAGSTKGQTMLNDQELVAYSGLDWGDQH